MVKKTTKKHGEDFINKCYWEIGKPNFTYKLVDRKYDEAASYNIYNSDSGWIDKYEIP